MLIGKVAKQIGITVETMRFYEKRGLVDPPARNASGYREYPEGTVQHVVFIKRAKELGFSLQEIKELLALRYLPGTTCREVRAQVVNKMEDIDRKVEDLLAIKKDLAQLASSCPGQGPVSQCPIIDSISTQLHEKTQ